MQKFQYLVVGSLLVNLLFFGLSILFVARRGGISYLLSKVAPARQPNTPLYLGRQDTYEKLPSTDAAVVFAGDSLTDLCPWHELLQRRVLNRGISGERVEGHCQLVDHPS